MLDDAASVSRYCRWQLVQDKQVSLAYLLRWIIFSWCNQLYYASWSVITRISRLEANVALSIACTAGGRHFPWWAGLILGLGLALLLAVGLCAAAGLWAVRLRRRNINLESQLDVESAKASSGGSFANFVRMSSDLQRRVLDFLGPSWGAFMGHQCSASLCSFGCRREIGTGKPQAAASHPWRQWLGSQN